ncbi:MAG: TRAP transporter substrate-binding protein DctP, partial [Spirochaetales bacterium]|nr:TRAP transporter substrate-binding protein DctP [Spirochaetales bacterium]
MKRKGSMLLSLVTAFVLLMVFASPAFCGGESEEGAVQESAVAGKEALPDVKLTFAAPHTPPQTYAVVDVAFIDHIKEVSDGKITLEYYPGGTLIGGNEAASELKAGTADFGWPRVGYTRHGYKLYNANLIWMYNLDPVTDIEAELEIYKKLYEKEEMYSEFDGIVPYGANASGTSAWLFTNYPIKSLADVKGKTIRANASWAKVITKLGGVPVNMPFSELYMALEKGTVDGVIGLPGTVIKGENLGDVIEYAMDIKMNQTPYYAWAFNERSWNKMPEAAREIFKTEELWLEDRVIEQLQNEEKPSIEYGKSLGIQFVDISEQDRNMLFVIMDEVCREACKALD